MFELHLLTGLLLNSGFIMIALSLRFLNFSGAGVLFVFGIAVFLSGHASTWILLTVLFFVNNGLKYVGMRKKAIKTYHTAASRYEMDWKQCCARYGIATLNMCAFSVSGLTPFFLASIVSLAVTASDSWAREIGPLSSSRVFSIGTLKPVEHGISGGITPAGLAASLGASLFVACLYFICFPWQVSTPFFALIVLFSGFFGSILDSFLGFLLQGAYLNRDGFLSELPGIAEGMKPVVAKGFPWIDDDMVDVLSNYSITMIAFIIGSVINS